MFSVTSRVAIHGPTARPDPDDAGFSLVELLTAIGIFSILMALVSTAVIRTYQTVSDAGLVSNVQAEEQNSMLWISRLLRYADNPAEGTTPTPWTPLSGAGSSGTGKDYLTFYTYSGTGPVDRVPYKAQLSIAGNGDLVNTVTTPTYVANYGYCYLRADANACSGITQDVRTRVLVRASKGHTPALTLTYYTSSGVSTPPPAGATDAAWRAWASAVASVKVSIADTVRSQKVEQTVKLVNTR